MTALSYSSAQTKTASSGRLNQETGRRTCFLPGLVTEMIFEWQSAARIGFGLVFPTDTGKPINLRKLQGRGLDSLMKEVGLMEPYSTKARNLSAQIPPTR